MVIPMPKPGRLRKQKRRARKIAEAEAAQGDAQRRAALQVEADLATATGGDHWGQGTSVSDAGLVRQSLRWSTDETQADIDATEPEAKSDRDVATMVTRLGMLRGNLRTSAAHVSNLIRMEGQNQRDDLPEEKRGDLIGAQFKFGSREPANEIVMEALVVLQDAAILASDSDSSAQPRDQS